MDTEGASPALRHRARLEGACLHSGGRGAVTVEASPGPVRFRAGDRTVTREDLLVVRTDRGVAVRLGHGGPVVDLVEHLLGALGGLGVQAGLRVTFESDEVPLLGGGASEHVAALRRLAPSPAPPRLRVTETATLEHGQSRYRFEPGDGVRLTVHTRFPEPLGEQSATWDGSAARFTRDLAPARTFGFAREAESLRAGGRARGVDPRAVMVFDDAGEVLEPGDPMRPDEIARHKLLDLVGDLYLHGGPPIGHIEAVRPGHGATHAIVRAALARGTLARTP